MKKMIISASIAFASIAIVQAAGSPSSSEKTVSTSQQQFARDTVPNQRRDSSWNNKKKYPDTTQRHRRDTMKVK